MINELEVQLFFRASDRKSEFQGNHGGWGAQFSGDRGDVIAGDSADGTAYIYDFGGGHIGGERGEHAAARHGKLHVAETQKRMAAQENAVGLYGRDGAGGVDGGVTLDEHHSRHFAGLQLRVVRARSGSATLRSDKTITL